MVASSTEASSPPGGSHTGGENRGIVRRMLFSRTAISLLLSLAAMTCGVLVFGYLASLKQPPAAQDRIITPYNVEVFDVELADLREVISAFGTARPYRVVTLSAQVAGEVVETAHPLKVGQAVRFPQATAAEGHASGSRHPGGGEVLVQIDPQTYQERVIQAQNRLAEIEADLSRIEQEEANNARLLEKVKTDYETFQEEYERVKQLREQRVASSSDLTRVLLELRQYEEAQLNRQNAQDLFPIQHQAAERRRQSTVTELRLAELDLEKTKISAPFDGVLSDVTVEQGQYVRPGEPLVEVTDVAEVEIVLPLALADHAKLMARVQSGEFPEVTLAVNESAEPMWTGSLVRMAPEADELTRTVNAYVEVDNRSQPVPLLPGMFVHARIDGPLLRRSIVVPRDAAVNERLFIVVDGRAQSRSIDVARMLETLAVVKPGANGSPGGVEPGDSVILTNLNDVYDGAPVRIQTHHSLEETLRDLQTSQVRASLAGAASDTD